jgi:hypothetical protein
MERRVTLVVGLALLVPCAGRAQARVEALFPAGAVVAVQRLGMQEAERARVGMDDLLPGDFLIAPDTAHLELRCPVDSETTYRLRGPFRVVLDIPREAGCHVNLLNGSANVLAAEPTEQTVGGVTLGSRGTQYAIVVERDAEGPSSRVIVFDGRVQMATAAGPVVVGPGTGVTYEMRSGRHTTSRTTSAQLQRWAGLYAAFDLNAAVTNGAEVPQYDRTYTRLQRLHYEVLSNPADTMARVNLAKTQLEYRVSDQATFNLRRAGVTSDAQLQRYQIDPRSVPLIRRSVGRSGTPRR